MPQGVVLDYELFDRYVLERDLLRVERIYRAQGYYEAHARAGRVEKTGDGHVKVTIVVEEGPVVVVEDIQLDGVTALGIDDTAAILRAIRRKRLREKLPFNEDNYDAARETAVATLADRGYAYADVKGSVDIDLVRHVAHVKYLVSPGRKAKVGTIRFAGLGSIPEEPVRRAVDLAPGETYSAGKLDAARQAVLNLGVFSEAEVTADLSHHDVEEVPIDVRVVPTDLRAVNVGGGLELTPIKTDLHLLTSWEDRNFLGALRKVTVAMRPGVVLYPTSLTNVQLWDRYLAEGRANAELYQPGFIEPRTRGTLRGAISLYPVLYEQQDTTAQTVLGYWDLSTGAGLDRSFGPLHTSVFYNFQTSYPFGYGGALPSDIDKKVVVSYVDLLTTLDLRDDAFHPRRGILIGNDLQFAGLPVPPNFRSPNERFPVDIKVQPEVRGYIPLTRSRRWTLALRATTGFLFPSNYASVGGFQQASHADAGDVQLLYFRGLFSGGPSSNRGYPYRGVGSRDQLSFLLPGVTPGEVLACKNPDGSQCNTAAAVDRYCQANPDALVCNFPTGGLSLWEASVEVRFPIAEKAGLGGALFCDASDVSREQFHLRWLYPHLSCGAGLHYDTPIGPIRLDAGFQIPGLQVLDPHSTEKPSPSFYAISFGIGEAF